jgi:hypothetical protein
MKMHQMVGHSREGAMLCYPIIRIYLKLQLFIVVLLVIVKFQQTGKLFFKKKVSSPQNKQIIFS